MTTIAGNIVPAVETEQTIAEIQAEISAARQIEDATLPAFLAEIDAEIASVSKEDNSLFVKNEIRWNLLDLMNEIHADIAPIVRAMRQAESY